MNTYNYKEYWKNATFDGGNPREDFMALLKSLLVPGSVLDAGCGMGRHTSQFKDRPYLGIDISNENIKIAKKRFPEMKFKKADLVTYKNSWGFNNVLCWTVLQHIQGDMIQKAVDNLKDLGDNIILCENVGSGEQTAASHVWHHDYEKLFTIVDKIKLPDTSVYLMRARA